MSTELANYLNLRPWRCGPDLSYSLVGERFAPSGVAWVEETLNLWVDDDCEVLGLVFDTFARIARVEASDN